jgi:hypothetical protein
VCLTHLFWSGPYRNRTLLSPSTNRPQVEGQLHKEDQPGSRHSDPDHDRLPCRCVGAATRCARPR